MSTPGVCQEGRVSCSIKRSNKMRSENHPLDLATEGPQRSQHKLSQGSEAAKPVMLEFQQEGRRGIGDTKWIIVLGGAEKGNSGKWDER